MNMLLIVLLFILATLVLGWLGRLVSINHHKWSIPGRSLILHGLGLIATVWYMTTKDTFAAWFTCLWIFCFFNEIEKIVSQGRKYWLPIKVVFGFMVSSTIIWLVQLETQFAEEEFYTFIKLIILILIWLFTNLLSGIILGKPKQGKFIFSRSLLDWSTAILFIIVVVGFVKTYQQSFYSLDVPSFPGLTPETPFICAEIETDSNQYTAQQVHQQYVKLIASNPSKRTPDYGFLALATNKTEWAQQFRLAILSEVESELFIQPANSVKYSQYEAALRAYYYARIKNTYSSLFTPLEIKAIENWFTEINQRALTVEWVDLLYALAFAKFPEGPYENQEIGSGLLSLLEKEKLADPQLSQQNRDYLDRFTRGWLTRFRNTDDAVFYQPEWQDNALFQSIYAGKWDKNLLNLSHQWLLLQALPDGSFLQYNQLSPADLSGSLIRGAFLTKEPEFLWAAGKSIDYLVKNNLFLHARPGGEIAPAIDGLQPDIGSCLLFGDSGLPNQEGPLAPDKIVLREGWSDNSTYLLENLRFTGWHRYKATNTIVSIYKGGSIIHEKTNGENISWLPVGRSLFRDKRIPRENLNGLSIPRSGMDKAISLLTGIGSQWSQDPPHYAYIESFATSDLVDTSSTRIKDWRGWSHTRDLSLYHGGPLAVIDLAEGPDLHSDPAIFWHLPLQSEVSGNRVQITHDESLAEMVILPISTNAKQEPRIIFSRDTTDLTVQYSSNDRQRLLLATVFLFDSWVNAKVWAEQAADGHILHIQSENNHLKIPIKSLTKT